MKLCIFRPMPSGPLEIGTMDGRILSCKGVFLLVCLSFSPYSTGVKGPLNAPFNENPHGVFSNDLSLSLCLSLVFSSSSFRLMDMGRWDVDSDVSSEETFFYLLLFSSHYNFSF